MLASEAPDLGVKAVSSGVLGIDLASGIGGFPRGRIVEIFGHESVGKTTVTIHAIAAAHARGEYCAFLDLEHAYSFEYGRALGVQDDKLLFFQPDTLNEALDTIKEYCKIEEVGLIVLDSIAISATKMQSAANAGDANIASKARILSDQIGDIVAKLSVNNKTLLILNSYRKDPSVTKGNAYYLPGGRAVPVSASVRIELSRAAPKQTDSGSNGNEVWAFFLKNKCSIPLKRTCFEIIYGKGADNMRPLFDAAVHYGIVDLNGLTYSLNGEKIGVGDKEAYASFKQLTQEHEGIREKVISCVKEQGYTLEIKKS